MLEAKRIILLSYARGEAQALKAAIAEAPDTMNPASSRQGHTDVDLF